MHYCEQHLNYCQTILHFLQRALDFVNTDVLEVLGKYGRGEGGKYHMGRGIHVVGLAAFQKIPGSVLV